MKSSVDVIEDAASQGGGKHGLDTILESYLSTDHRDRAEMLPTCLARERVGTCE